MGKYLLFVIIVLASLSQEMNGQDIFSVPANYGFLCDEARYLCGSELDGYTGSLLQQASPSPQPLTVCNNTGTSENTQWISFIADDPILHISISFDNCTFTNSNPGLSTGLYMDCNINMLPGETFEIACATQEASSATIDLQPDPTIIIPGNIYYLYIDGYDGSVCDYTVNVISGVCIEQIPTNIECAQDCGVTNQLFDNHSCTGFTDTLLFQPASQIFEDLSGCNPFVSNALLDSIVYIDWEITPNTGFTVHSTPMYFDSLNISSLLEVTWDLPGTYTIKPLMSINPLYATCRGMCECTDDVAYTITVLQSTLDTLPLVELCPNKTYEFCDQTYSSDIDVTCEDRDNCSITFQEIRVLTRVDLPIDTHYICANDCFEFNNVEFCTPNLFNIPSPTACDTFFQFQLIELDLNVNLTIAETLIDCINDNAAMTAEYTTNYPDSVQIFWLNEIGDTVSKTENYIATSDGTFTFHAVPLNAIGCVQTISNTVTVDDQIPTVSLSPPLLDCNNASDIILLSSADNIDSVAWSGPNGFSSSIESPTVTEGGIYSVSVTTTNGCNISETIEVMANFTEPDLEITHDDFDCSENIPVAQYTSSSDIVSVLWTSASETSSDQILNLQSIGNYTLTVTSVNGCTAAESFTVLDNSYDPTLNLNEDYTWRCNDTEKIIDVTTLLNPTLNYQWTTIDGDIASTTEILTINAPGIFILTSTDSSFGCVGQDTVRIMEDNDLFSDIEFVVNNPSCFAGSDGTIEVTSFIGGEGPFTYKYEESIFTDISTIQFSTGMHTISIFDKYECEVNKTFEITSSPPFEIITEPDVTIKYEKNGILTADVNIDDNQLNSIIWSDEEGNFLAEGKEVEISFDQELIIITAEDINGCIATATVILTIDYEVEIFYPNVFSPNGDGTNDNFMLFNNGLLENMNSLQIFDRSGELIFEKTNMLFNESQSGWNGEFNGQAVQPGVYVFIINYTLGNGESKIKSGSITVIR